MIRGLKNVPPTDAVGMSSSLLATAPDAGRLPPGAGRVAIAVAPLLPELVDRARAGHEALLNALAERDGRVIHRGTEVQDARAAEAALDRRVSALHQRLKALVREEIPGADDLLAWLFPDGARKLVRLRGRAQRARYQQWARTFPDRPQQGSAADRDIERPLGRIEREIVRFGEVIDGKDRVSRGATEAVDDAGAAFGAWVEAMGELAQAMSVVLASDPGAWGAWIAPYREWRAAQGGRR